MLVFGSLFSILYISPACSDWTRVEEDCRRAIQLDHDSAKVSIVIIFPSLFFLPLSLCCEGKQNPRIVWLPVLLVLGPLSFYEPHCPLVFVDWWTMNMPSWNSWWICWVSFGYSMRAFVRSSHRFRKWWRWFIRKIVTCLSNKVRFIAPCEVVEVCPFTLWSSLLYWLYLLAGFSSVSLSGFQKFSIVLVCIKCSFRRLAISRDGILARCWHLSRLVSSNYI